MTSEAFESGTGVSHLYGVVLAAYERALTAEAALAEPRCPYGGRHGEYETCDICDRKLVAMPEEDRTG